MFVGRTVAGKGWDVFLDAVAALHSRGTDVDGELLGDGAELDEARRRAGELGLDGVVAVRGRVSPDEVRRALRGATLVNCSLPCRWPRAPFPGRSARQIGRAHV